MDPDEERRMAIRMLDILPPDDQEEDDNDDDDDTPVSQQQQEDDKITKPNDDTNEIGYNKLRIATPKDETLLVTVLDKKKYEKLERTVVDKNSDRDSLVTKAVEMDSAVLDRATLIQQQGQEASDWSSTSSRRSPSLPGAYHIPHPDAQAGGLHSRTRYDEESGATGVTTRSSIPGSYSQPDDAAIFVVPTASVVKENDYYSGDLVEASPLEIPVFMGNNEAHESKTLPKDAVWIGRKRARLYGFCILLLVIGLVAGLSAAIVGSKDNSGDSANSSLTDNLTGGTVAPTAAPPPTLFPTEAQTADENATESIPNRDKDTNGNYIGGGDGSGGDGSRSSGGTRGGGGGSGGA